MKPKIGFYESGTNAVDSCRGPFIIFSTIPQIEESTVIMNNTTIISGQQTIFGNKPNQNT